MTNRIRVLALTAAIVPLLASCDSGGPALTPHLKFSYSGLAAGSFEVTGTKTEGNSQGVLAFKDSGIVVLIGITFDNTSPVSFVTMAFTAGEGSIPFAASCEVGAGCTGLVFDLTVSAGAIPLTCTMSSGTLTVSSSDNKRSNGTFSGTATCVDASDGETVVGTVEITAGSFAANHGASPFGGG
jgi:hypothetical protein